jgi:hypothetical protein
MHTRAAHRPRLQQLDGERICHTRDRTKISLCKGERWFCSERQALDAGWCAPLR